VNEESKESPVKTLYITMTSLNFPDILHVMGNISLKGHPACVGVWGLCVIQWVFGFSMELGGIHQISYAHMNSYFKKMCTMMSNIYETIRLYVSDDIEKGNFITKQCISNLVGKLGHDYKVIVSLYFLESLMYHYILMMNNINYMYNNCECANVDRVQIKYLKVNSEFLPIDSCNKK
jgi:hypothetical protein